MAVALYILMLRLPIPLTLKYPTPGAFPMGVSLTQENPPQFGHIYLAMGVPTRIDRDSERPRQVKTGVCTHH